MPPSLYDVMMEKIGVLQKSFAAAADSHSSVTFDWLVIDKEAIIPVLQSLEWWLSEDATSTKVSEMLPTS